MPESLIQLRHSLLRLHKILLDWERGRYERARGPQSAGALIHAFLQDQQFAWLRPMSQLIVRIDELLEQPEPPADAEVKAIVAQARALTAPGEQEDDYSSRYRTALQELPDAVVAHRDVVGLLTEGC
jgi:hypothetical protein